MPRKHKNIRFEGGYTRRGFLKILCLLLATTLSLARTRARSQDSARFVIVDGWILKTTDLTDG
ncbi:MAG: hypothetical protein OEQ18_08385 [Gammaproteobacteria bacterium]|nr:hypothetical protein [Gammaproteobacteria bacterium]